MPRLLSLLFALLVLALLHRPAFAEGDTVWTVKIPGTSFADVEYSPDGKYIAAASGWVYLLDPKDGSVVKDFRFSGATLSLYVPEIAFSADGNTIAAGINKDNREYFIHWWDVETGETTWSLPTPGQPDAMSFSRDRRFFAAADDKENFWVWNVSGSTPELLWEDREPGFANSNIWFSPDGEYILYSKGGVMKLRRVADSTVVRRWNFAYGACMATPDAQLCIANIGPVGLGIFDRQNDKPIDTLPSGDHNPGFAAARITTGGKYIATSGEQKIKIWDLESRSVVREYPGAEGISISPDSAYIVTAGAGAGVVRLYRFNTTTVGVEHQPSDTPLSLRITPNPAEGSATAVFTLPEGSAQTVGIDILNTTGSLLISLPQQTLQPGEHTLALPVETLAAGTYFCRLRVGEMEQIVQFVVK